MTLLGYAQHVALGNSFVGLASNSIWCAQFYFGQLPVKNFGDTTITTLLTRSLSLSHSLSPFLSAANCPLLGTFISLFLPPPLSLFL